MRAVAGQRRAAAKSRRRGGEVRSRTIHLGQERCARGGAGEKTSRMKIQRLAYVLQIFPKLSETFIAGELAELRRRGVEVRILSLLPPRAEVQHDIVHRAGLAELTTYDVDAFPSVVRAFRPQLLHAHFATDATAKARELAARCELPFTFTAHGYDIHRKPPPDFRERALAARGLSLRDDRRRPIARRIESEARGAWIGQRGGDARRGGAGRSVAVVAAGGGGRVDERARRDASEPDGGRGVRRAGGGDSRGRRAGAGARRRDGFARACR